MDRRRFFQLLSTLLCAVYAAFLAIPGIKFLQGPLQNARKGNRRHRLAKLDDLEMGVPRKAVVLDQRVDAWTRYPKGPIGSVWLIKRDDETVEAFSAVCPHLGCSVQHVGEDDQFYCPCHEAKFGVDGAIISGPSRRGLDSLNVVLSDEDGETWVEVMFEKYELGIPEKKTRG